MGKQGVTSVADKETKCTLHPVSGAKQLEIETVTLTEPAYTVSPLHRIYSANRLSTQCGEGTTGGERRERVCSVYLELMVMFD